MSKELLIDHIPFNIAKVTLLSESKIAGGRMRIKGKIQEAEQKNGNGRVYPKEILQREIDNYIKEQVNNNTSMGELDHPDSSIVNLNNVAHIIKKIWWEGNDVIAELELLNTPSGKIAQELIMANIPLGISSRGMGSIRQIGKTIEVQDDFSLLCFDLVSVPSTPKAYLTLAEGKQYNSIKDYTKVNSLITEIICTTTGTCALC